MPTAGPYGADRALPYATLRRLATEASQRATQEIYTTGRLELLAMLRHALTAGGLEASRVALEFALALDQTVRSSKNQLANLHHQVGRLAQEAVVAAYLEDHRSKGRHIAPYRESTRDAAGRLERALRSPAFFRGTPDGIGFVNTVLLDAEARQWHRLNFGAAPRAGPRSGQFPVTFDGLVVGALGLGDSPSAGFVLPRGVWVGEGGERDAPGGRGGQFYPQSQRTLLRGRGILGAPNRVRRTRGIAAWNFLDAGVAVIGRELGPAYVNLHGDWARSAARSVGPLSRVVR